MAVDSHVRIQYPGVSLDDVFTAVAGLIQAEAIDLLDADDSYLGIGPKADEVSKQLLVADSLNS